ncbi:hypothetical protein BJ993_000740 [Nocardioides aromaticivorans]|uniref:DUF732 domain-containing protein n=1 Tax=Nocardioides aromaticivorans TaxID=200618 RepID=A0A7Y9ZGP3_9ACTN|nr:hypothetical protein [Nocardioides aromaticivorans]NYI43660.1 hypothetical protein [Nocardioides aromaticivorans]
MRVRTLAAAAVVLTLAAGCRATEWPSDADPAEFCDGFTGLQFTEDGIDEGLRQLGTPQDLPFEARRYLLDLDEGKDPDPAGEQAFEEYVAAYC